MIDTTRHLELFDPRIFQDRINIIGAGATGSWLALILTKLGIKGEQINVWDFDAIEEHNIANQAFKIEQIGESKVHAIQNNIHRQTGTTIEVRDAKYEQQRLAGYVFLMVDTMAERKRIWEQAIKRKSAIKLLIEPRMGLKVSRVYNVIPTDANQIEEYEETFYSDDDAEQSACGASQTVVTTAMATASQCAVQLIKHATGESLPNEILTDFFNNNVFEMRWGSE